MKKTKITKNPADDVSFEELGRMIREFYYLGNGIEQREKKRTKLLEEILKEVHRLQEIGYDLKKLNTTVLKNHVM